VKKYLQKYMSIKKKKDTREKKSENEKEMKHERIKETSLKGDASLLHQTTPTCQFKSIAISPHLSSSFLSPLTSTPLSSFPNQFNTTSPPKLPTYSPFFLHQSHNKPLFLSQSSPQTPSSSTSSNFLLYSYHKHLPLLSASIQ
jgi:hypothetical protein